MQLFRVAKSPISFFVVGILIFTGCSADNNPVPPVSDPVADFSWSGDLSAPATVTFMNNSQNANRYLWDFADGLTSIDTNPLHVFQIARTYQVVLIALDSVNGKSHTTFKTLTIDRPYPVSDFVWSGSTYAPATITFSARCQNTSHYLWSFEDGDSSSLMNPTHTFHNESTYNVTLIASDSISGKKDSSTKSLVILQPVTIADFTWSGLSVTPARILFENLSQNADLYHWDFGDNRTSVDANPIIDFTSYGNFSITLTATSSLTSNSDTIRKVLTITPGKMYIDTVYIDEIPFTDRNGSRWDPTSGPDLYFILYAHDVHPIFTSTVFQDVVPGDLPIIWSFVTPGFPAVDFRSLSSFQFYDEDNDWPLTHVAGIDFRIPLLTSTYGYVANYSLSSGSTRMRIAVSWE